MFTYNCRACNERGKRGSGIDSSIGGHLGSIFVEMRHPHHPVDTVNRHMEEAYRGGRFLYTILRSADFAFLQCGLLVVVCSSYRRRRSYHRDSQVMYFCVVWRRAGLKCFKGKERKEKYYERDRHSELVHSVEHCVSCCTGKNCRSLGGCGRILSSTPSDYVK